MILLFYPQEDNSKCDQCSVGDVKKTNMQHVLVMCLYPFGFLQTGGKGSFICLRVLSCFVTLC